MPKKTGIGILTAVPFEAALLIKEMKGARKDGPFTHGKISGKNVVHMVTGMGAANAAHGATLLLERHSPDVVVLAGIGGAYPGAGVGVGDVAAAEREVYADLGVLTANGLLPLEETGIPLLVKGRKKFYNEFPLDRRLLREAARHLKELKTGVFLTVSRITGTDRRAKELAARHGAICENMEGAAVAQICTAYGVPLLEIRGISNMVEDRDMGKWEKALAAENCQRAVIEIIRGL